MLICKQSKQLCLIILETDNQLLAVLKQDHSYSISITLASLTPYVISFKMMMFCLLNAHLHCHTLFIFQNNECSIQNLPDCSHPVQNPSEFGPKHSRFRLLKDHRRRHQKKDKVVRMRMPTYFLTLSPAVVHRGLGTSSFSTIFLNTTLLYTSLILFDNFLIIF